MASSLLRPQRKRIQVPSIPAILLLSAYSDSTVPRLLPQSFYSPAVHTDHDWGSHGDPNRTEATFQDKKQESDRTPRRSKHHHDLIPHVLLHRVASRKENIAHSRLLHHHTNRWSIAHLRPNLRYSVSALANQGL